MCIVDIVSALLCGPVLCSVSVSRSHSIDTDCE